jgi:hypothetical protein
MPNMKMRLFLAAMIVCFVAARSPADDVPHTTDVNELTSSEYWNVRYAAMMLDIAQSQHQPDIAIHYALDDPIRQAKGLATQFPNDPEVAAIAKKLADADAKLDLSDLSKNAFSQSCPWLTTSFGDSWEKFHQAQEYFKAGRKDDASDELNDTKTALAHLADPAVTKEWPDSLKKSLDDIRTGLAKLELQIKG